MKNRLMCGRSVLVGAALVVGLGPAVLAQQSLRDLATQEGVAWLAGRWAAVTDEGQTVQIAYRWVAGGYAAAMDFRMGELVLHEMIYLVADQERVVSISADNRGNLGKGTWEVDAGRIVVRSATTGPDGQTREMGVVYTKVDDNTMKAAVYGIEYGQLAYDPWATLEFKRQSRQPRRPRADADDSTPAPQSLRDLAIQEGAAWLAGRWQGATDAGQEILMSFRWVADGHAIVGMGRSHEALGYGLIYKVPGRDEVASVHISSRGGVSKGTWAVEGDRIIDRCEITEPYAQARHVAAVYTKIDETTMRAEVYGIENGRLSREPLGKSTVEFKRQTRPSGRVRTTSVESRL